MAFNTTQPVNITGVRLSNPTGMIGNYNLSYIIDLKKGSWKYNGVVYSGSILTVGSGGDYAGLYDAYDAIAADPTMTTVLILVSGNVNANGLTNATISDKTIFIRGTGATSHDTLIDLTVGNQYYYYLNNNVYFENVELTHSEYRRCISFLADSENNQFFTNKCNLFPNGGYCYGSSDAVNYKVNSANFSYTSMGNGSEFKHFCWLNVSQINCDKVLFDGIPTGYQCYGGTIAGNWAETPTEGYGSAYGSLLITDWTYLDEKTLSWGGGSLVEIPTDGDYTLSDGTNTITATVDYSALPATNQSDTITISCYDRYWVGGSGLWTDTAHWALTSGGAGGNAAPTINDDVYIDENSFSTAGQIIKVP